MNKILVPSGTKKYEVVRWLNNEKSNFCDRHMVKADLYCHSNSGHHLFYSDNQCLIAVFPSDYYVKLISNIP